MIFTTSKDGKVSVAQVLVPVSIISFVLFIMLAFQSTQVLRERDALHQAKARQDKPIEEAQKVQAQLDALAVGTKKLADGGNKSAEAIIARMKQLGITVNDSKTSTVTPTVKAPTAPAAAPTDEPKE